MNVAPRKDERHAKRQAIAEAWASVEANGAVPHAKVRDWLLSWGEGDEVPPPEPCTSSGQRQR